MNVINLPVLTFVSGAQKNRLNELFEYGKCSKITNTKK